MGRRSKCVPSDVHKVFFPIVRLDGSHERESCLPIGTNGRCVLRIRAENAPGCRWRREHVLGQEAAKDDGSQSAVPMGLFPDEEVDARQLPTKADL